MAESECMDQPVTPSDVPQRFIIKWSAALLVGWGVGLLLCGLALAAGLLLSLVFNSLLFLFAALLVGGALAGGFVGAAQQYFLRAGQVDQRYVVFSAIGGAQAGLVTIVFYWLTLSWFFAALLIGGAAAGFVAAAQWAAVRGGSPLPIPPVSALVWMGTHLGGGAICALLTFTGEQMIGYGLALPITCFAGTFVFALITATAFLTASAADYPPEVLPDAPE